MIKSLKKVFILIFALVMASTIFGCKKEAVNPVKGNSYAAKLEGQGVLKIRFAEKVVDIYLDEVHIEDTDVYDINTQTKTLSFRKAGNKVSMTYQEDGSQISGKIDGETVTLKKIE